jgi:hypothetical protein
MKTSLLALSPLLAFTLACTGLLGEEKTDDSGGSASTDPCKWYRDQDGDGFGDIVHSENTCEKPSGYVANADDCDDEDARANPDATEVCDKVDADEDCNGKADEEDEGVVLTVFFQDDDTDGYGNPEKTAEGCDAPDGYVENSDDCDDTDRRVNPDGQEICDGEGGDEDCDGLVDSDDDSMASTNLPTWYIDSDKDGYGASGGGTKKQCDQPTGYAINDDDCDDTDKNVNPGETEVCGNGVDDNCNDSADGCGLTGSYSLSSADLIITGPTSGAMGYAVCGGGDIDGDGRDDIVLGAPNYSSDGAGYAFYGGAKGAKTYSNANATFTGESAGDYFGAACTLDDFDGDGEADVGFGDPYYTYSSSYPKSGRAYLFHTPISSSEPASSANTIYTNSYNSSDYLGITLASGDWNGDGKADLIMGATENYVFMDYGAIGTSSGKDIFGINEFEGALTYSGVVASGGDLDGDGSDDLVVTDLSGKGSAYIFDGEFGGSITLSSYASATITGPSSDSYFGNHADIRGDIDGDGYADLLTGAPYTASSAGMAYGCFGPLTSNKAASSCDLVITGQTASSSFGWDVAYVGDENGDGDDDFMVSAPGMRGDSAGAGVTYLFRGNLSGSKRVSDADASFLGSHNYGAVGYSIGRAGDFNGDGNDDLLIAGPSANSSTGMAYVMFGGGF